jgi:hypothetical protein
MFNSPRKTIRIRAIKRRDGAVVEGTFSYDGLADLWPVEQADGSVAYVSCLDEIESWDEVQS